MHLVTKWAIGVVGLFVCAVIAFIVYLHYAIPRLSETPRAPVIAVPFFEPPSYPKEHYQGQHPRLSGRPMETAEFPIALGALGPAEPLFAGPNRHPFYCGRNRITNLQPQVDNQDGYGVPVFNLIDGQQGEDVIGYSLNCSHPTSARYYYNKVDTQQFFPLEDANNDIAKIIVNGRKIDFVIRAETGTINRFHYLIVALRGEGEDIAQPESSNWNKRLIYQFRGGVGIGKRQGNISLNDVVRRRFEEVKAGYAVIYSSANQTSNHYNLWLAEDTALRVKRQFVTLYGQPDYTVGIGGSGGAIQQYLFAQNNPSLLDAIIPLYSYPDMVTQTIHVLDCELLEYYFDVTAVAESRWRDWEQRVLIEGMNADNLASNQFSDLTALVKLLRGGWPSFKSGASECVNGYRGLTPLVHNPKFVHFIKDFASNVGDQVHWTHWEDLQAFYGVNQEGYANSTWDNVGVQYGLHALTNGDISIAEFVRINTEVGGWKPAHVMEDEKLWLLTGEFLPLEVSVWGDHNATFSEIEEGKPAARTAGSEDAMEGAYRSGHVFMGFADLPIIDARHYLEHHLDMHHVTASFASRQRLLDGQGWANNQLIWISDENYDPSADALAMVDRWMTNIQRNPELSVAENKPDDAKDKCFDADGNIIAAGDSVWDGDWNNKASGKCAKQFPRFRTSREVAGDRVAGRVFKCRLQSVQAAINSGVYGNVDMTTHQQTLEAIFPEGVCDYRLGDAGEPADLLTELRNYGW